MKITKAQAIKLGQEFEKIGWGVFDGVRTERRCCGEDREETDKFCSDCGKKLVTKISNDDDTVADIVRAVGKI